MDQRLTDRRSSTGASPTGAFRARATARASGEVSPGARVDCSSKTFRRKGVESSPRCLSTVQDAHFTLVAGDRGGPPEPATWDEPGNLSIGTVVLSHPQLPHTHATDQLQGDSR